MARTPSELTIKLWQLLADGEWRDMQPVLQALMASIPPGVARRYAEGLSKADPDSPAYRGPRPKDVLIAAGARALSVKTITSAARVYRVQIDPPKLSRDDWRFSGHAGEAPRVRLRWIGDPFGAYVEDSVAAGRLDAIVGVHVAGEAGMCVECRDQRHPCTTYVLATGAARASALPPSSYDAAERPSTRGRSRRAVT